MNYVLEGREIFEKIYATIQLWFLPLDVNNYRPKFLQSKALLYVAIFLMTAKILTVVVQTPFPQNFFFADITKSSLTILLNQSREAQGLNALTESTALNQAAALKAQDMVSNGYFAHKSPTGLTPWHWFAQAGYTYKYAGENLAAGFIDSPEVFYAWFNSPSHKANMVNPNYKEVGTAVLYGFEGNSIVVVQLFGSLKTTVATKPSLTKPASVAKTQPVPKPITPVIIKTDLEDASTVSPAPQVLSAISESGVYAKPNNNAATSTYLKVLNFVVYGNSEALQYMAYLLLLTIGSCLFFSIIVSADKLHGGLIVRSLAVMVILCVSLSINQDLLTHIIPHQIII